MSIQPRNRKFSVEKPQPDNRVSRCQVDKLVWKWSCSTTVVVWLLILPKKDFTTTPPNKKRLKIQVTILFIANILSHYKLYYLRNKRAKILSPNKGDLVHIMITHIVPQIYILQILVLWVTWGQYLKQLFRYK